MADELLKETEQTYESEKVDLIDQQVQEIMEVVHKNYEDADVSQIEKAYQFAKKAHGDQKRRSGEPYIVHPVSVAYILASYQMDIDTVIAALLHDVIEDTEYTYDDIAETFNKHIAYMVESVSKITRMNYQSKEESQAEYIRKMVLSMSNDVRIIIIKLVDRLHNMRTLEYMTTKKQMEKSRETLDIYAPIANRLGIQSIKSELEDLAFKYLDNKNYEDLQNQIHEGRSEREAYINEVVKTIKDEIEDFGIKNAKVYGRSKHLYGIYQKMRNSGRDFDEIYDLYAVRILVDSVEDCYAALGVVHTRWRALPNRMKDYITMPKANGYQSLHTTVLGPHGTPLEVQIRTREMHQIDEYGIAAHWKYKEGKKNQTKEKYKRFDEGIAWLRQMIDWSQDFENNKDFMDTMISDIFPKEVYVFTPDGDVVDLPAGSTPVDFAYKIHTEIGNHCIGAKVNNKVVPLNYTLRLGDIVSIMTSKSSKGPSQDWLKFVKSRHAKSKIRHFFKLAESDRNIRRGKRILEAEMAKLGEIGEDLLNATKLQVTAESLGYKTTDEMFLSLGAKTIKTGLVLNKMELLFPELFPQEEEELLISEAQALSHGESNIIVAGLEGIDTHFAHCCNPIPGDKIIGYTTKNNGISIHRMDCQNVIHVKDPSRVVEVHWNKHIKPSSYKVDLFIESYSVRGGLLDVLQPFYDQGIPIVSTETRTVGDQDLFNISCEVKNLRQLNILIKEVRKVPTVMNVVRK